jgi:putative DNA primase/helicase
VREGRTQLPHGFRLTQEYLWYEKQVQRNGETEIQNVKICNPLRVTAITCDADGGNFGRLLEWEDTWGERRRWAMPMEMLSGSGEELRRVLLVNGLSYISTTGEARARLMEYISLCKPERRVTCVSRTGWHGQVYVLQDEVSGEGAESVILQTTSVQGAISACRAQRRNGGSTYPATAPATPAWRLPSVWPLLHPCYGWLVWTAAATTSRGNRRTVRPPP